MKKNILFVILSSILLPASCNLNSKNENNETGVVQFTLEQSRTVSPVNSSSFDFQSAEWHVVFTSSADGNVKYEKDIKLSEDASITVPLDTYDIQMTTSFSADETTYNYVASKNGCEIKAGENQISMYYELQKTETGKGSLSYVFSFALEDYNEFSEDENLEVKAELVSVKDASIKYNGETSNLDNTFTFDFKDIPSGIYVINFTYSETDVTYAILTKGLETRIEIADGLETSYTGPVEQAFISRRVYFVTYDKTVGNGFYEDYPMNINDALDVVAKSDDISSVMFYYTPSQYGMPEISLDVSKLATGKLIGIEVSGTSSGQIMITQDGVVGPDADCSLCFILFDSNADDENYVPKTVYFENVTSLYSTSFKLQDSISLNVKFEKADYLQNGGTIFVTDFSSYTDKPFMTIVAPDSETALSTECYTVYDNDSAYNETGWYYTKKSPEQAGGNAEYAFYVSEAGSSLETGTLSASYNGKSLTTGDETALELDTSDKEKNITFTVSATGDVSSYRWFYSDSAEVIGKESDYSINPFTTNLVDETTGVVSISCLYKEDDEWKVQTFDVKIYEPLSGLYLDAENEYFMYFDANTLYKGRGTYIKELSSGTYEVYNEVLEEVEYSDSSRKPAFAYDCKDSSYKYELCNSISFTDLYGDEQLDYSKKDGKEYFKGTINGKDLSFTKYTGLGNFAYMDSKYFNSCYYIANSTATGSLVNPVESLKNENGYYESGYIFNDIQNAVNAANLYKSANSSSYANAIIYVESDYTATSLTTVMTNNGDGSDSYIQFDSSYVYLIGIPDADGNVPTIDSSAMSKRTLYWKTTETGSLNIQNLTLVGADVSNDTGTLDYYRNGGVIYISTGNRPAYINLRSGTTVTGGTAVFGGGIYSYGNHESEYLNVYSGAKIIGNKAVLKYNDEGTAIASGDGAGIYTGYNSNVNLYGGNIGTEDAPNIADGNGGGIYKGYILMKDGASISYNQATIGAGVYVYQSKLDMNGGSINNNTATGNGGGIDIDFQANVSITGGTISYNSATGEGAGIYVVDEVTLFTISGGTITENKKSTDGELSSTDYDIYSEKTDFDPTTVFVDADGKAIDITTIIQNYTGDENDTTITHAVASGS